VREREGTAREDKVRGKERNMNMSTSVPIGAGRWICTGSKFKRARHKS
jgi:hypothetical protein